AGALLVAGLSIYVSRRLARRTRQAPVAPARPAAEVALERLDALRQAGLLECGEWKPFYFGLSEILREDLGARYGFDGLDKTTPELLAALRAAQVAGADLATIEGWAASCDLVKFAKHTPALSEAQDTLQVAYGIVEATRPRPAVVEPSLPPSNPP